MTGGKTERWKVAAGTILFSHLSRCRQVFYTMNKITWPWILATSVNFFLHLYM